MRLDAVARQSLSVGVATGAYGLSFGALSVAAGLDLWQTQALSALLFTGGSQFAVVGILGAGGLGSTAVATSSLLGIRNGLYGLELSRELGFHGWRRVAAAHLTIDESTAVAMAQSGRADARRGFWLTGLAVFVPYLGFGLGLVMGLLAAVLQFQSVVGVALVGAVYAIGQVAESMYVTPRLLGERIGLHPIAVIFALMAFGQLFGFVGVLIALPASAVLLVAIRRARASYMESDLYLAGPESPVTPEAASSDLPPEDPAP